jgi:hypothetical protein
MWFKRKISVIQSKMEQQRQKQNLEYMPESHGVKFFQNGKQVVLTYTHEKDVYFNNNIETTIEKWHYYGWDEIFKLWMRVAGYIERTSK